MKVIGAGKAALLIERETMIVHDKARCTFVEVPWPKLVKALATHRDDVRRRRVKARAAKARRHGHVGN